MRTALLAFALALSAAPAALAQGAFGIGGQAGDPTGVSLKVGTGPGSFDFAAGFGRDGDVFLQAHYLLRDRRLPTAGANVRLFFGPGGYVDIRDPDTRAGLSANFGLGFFPAREFEVFGQLTPRLRLTPETDFELGAAAGVRFYP